MASLLLQRKNSLQPLKSCIKVVLRFPCGEPSDLSSFFFFKSLNYEALEKKINQTQRLSSKVTVYLNVYRYKSAQFM